MKLFATPSRLVLITGAVLIGTMGFVAGIIGILHWRERVRRLHLLSHLDQDGFAAKYLEGANDVQFLSFSCSFRQKLCQIIG